MQTLEQIWKRLKAAGYETDKGSTHSYIPVYEKLLAPYRETALNVLEIGLFNGNSMRMWTEYFTHPYRKIHGVDCSLTPHDGLGDLRPIIKEKNPGQYIFILDAENRNEVDDTFHNDIKFDVIIEDAGHEINQQLNLYSIWKNYLAKGGIYIIEDIQDLDRDAERFNKQGFNVYDLRTIKNRYDDVIAIK